MLTESHVDRLLAEGSSLVDAVRWAPQLRNSRWTQFAAFLDSPSETALRLVMAVNTSLPGKYTILLLRGEQVLRRLDVRGSHRNPTAASGAHWSGETHKHRWTDDFADKVAYAPADITTADPFDRSEYEATFRAFCAECSIAFSGAWSDPPEQTQGTLDL
jgi:hypothetical protein